MWYNNSLKKVNVMERQPESSQGQRQSNLPTNQNLSPEFKQYLEEEALKQRAWAMVDAMLEENPSLDPEKAFEEALKLLKNQLPQASVE